MYAGKGSCYYWPEDIEQGWTRTTKQPKHFWSWQPTMITVFIQFMHWIEIPGQVKFWLGARFCWWCSLILQSLFPILAGLTVLSSLLFLLPSTSWCGTNQYNWELLTSLLRGVYIRCLSLPRPSLSSVTVFV